jgi:hypothetical protein
MDVMNWSLESLTPFGPCLICGSEKNIEMHHVKHLRKDINISQKGFTVLMAKLNRKQIPGRSCHIKIHRGLYNGMALRTINPTLEGPGDPNLFSLSFFYYNVREKEVVESWI